MSQETDTGAVIAAREFVFEPGETGAETAAVVGPHLGAEHVTLDVVRVPAGRHWQAGAADREQVVVIHEGEAKAEVDGTVVPIERASSLYVPTGLDVRIDADSSVVAYVWSSTLRPHERPGSDPATASSLWDDTTQLTGFAGTAGIDAGARPATMNFVFWPGTGSPRLCLHCGMQESGEAFNVHTHPESDEVFFVVEGVGQVYLADRWIDVGPGDVLFARPGVPHGTRNPATGPGPRFSTCGGPTPFDPMLYARAGVSSEVV